MLKSERLPVNPSLQRLSVISHYCSPVWSNPETRNKQKRTMSKAASKFGCFLYEKETPKKEFLSKWTNWNQRLPCGFCTYYHFMFWIPVSIGVFQIPYQYQKYPLSSLKYWNLHGCAHMSMHWSDIDWEMIPCSSTAASCTSVCN